MPATFRTAPLAKIASGGTATVFVGASRGRGLVALKRPHPHVLEDERQRVEVLREAALAASIQHPNVAGMYEVETSGDEVQLVMEYVEGAALGSLIVAAARLDARLPTRVALRIVLDACLGLAAVHRQTSADGTLLGLVHRDVSPQNILVGVDGRARVTDFGLAKAMYTAAPSTTQGTLKGKLGYMAPEYVHRGQVDRRVDVFAMGVVLWEAVAGQRLFRGDNEAQTLDRVLRSDPTPLSEISPGLAPLDPVVARATSKDPEGRFESADALAAALGTAGAQMNSIASPAEVAAYVESVAGAELSERRTRVNAARRVRRRPAWIVASTVVVLSAAGATVGLLGRHEAARAPPLSPSATTSAAAVPSSTNASRSDASAAIEFGLPDARPPPSPRASVTTTPPRTTSTAHGVPPNPYDRRGR